MGFHFSSKNTKKVGLAFLVSMTGNSASLEVTDTGSQTNEKCA